MSCMVFVLKLKRETRQMVDFPAVEVDRDTLVDQ